MKKNCFGMFLFTMMLLSLPDAARAEKEGGGGSIVVDGVTYDLADLHFVPLPSEGFQLDEELTRQLKSIDKAMWDVGVPIMGGASGRFFERQVFSNKVEYRLVAQLPANCKFIPSENLPPGMPGIPAACTKGFITYILPREFVKLDLLKKALLIVHERLQPFSPDQDYELYTSLVHGMYVLVTRFHPALVAQDESLILNPKELYFLNLLSKRIIQLSGSDDRPKYHFTENGGMLVSYNNKISGKNIRIYAGSKINASQGISIMGSDISIRKTQVWHPGSMTVVGNQFEIQGLSTNSNAWGQKVEIRFFENTSLQNLVIRNFSSILTFGSTSMSTVLDGQGLIYGFPSKESVQVASQDELPLWKVCMKYEECHKLCPLVTLTPKPNWPLPQTVTINTGVTFTDMTNYEPPQLGQGAWMDPCGLIWGDFSDSIHVPNFYRVRYSEAATHCKEIGARLPSWDEFKRLREFFGAQPGSYYGYSPRLLPHLSSGIAEREGEGNNFWADPSDSEPGDRFRYLFNGDTGQIRAVDPALPLDDKPFATFAVRCVIQHSGSVVK